MKRYRIASLLAISLTALLASACSMDVDDTGTETVGTTSEAALNMNGLPSNALNMNGVAPPILLGAHGMQLLALNPNGGDPAILSMLQNPGSDGDLARQLFKAMVGCALSPSQSLGLVWTDSSNVTHRDLYTGIDGLATNWASGPLSVSGQHWVSACVGGLINPLAHITVSFRGGSIVVGASESLYTRREGATFGNMFTKADGGAPVGVFSCADTANAAHSNSAPRQCETGATSCGVMQQLFDCAAFCGVNASGNYVNCIDDGVQGSEGPYETITSVLQ